MYQLISAIGRPLNGDGRWAAIEIGAMPMNLIYSTYAKVYAILTNPFVTGQISLDMQDIRSAHGGKTITFNDVLASIGSDALPTSTELPVLNPRYAKYNDAFRAGYTVTPVHPTIAPDAQIPPSDKPWLKLTRPDTDYAVFHKACLVSVNGFFHLTDADSSGVYVVDGMRSNLESGENIIGLYSFREVGELSFIQITPEMLYKQRPEQEFKDRCYVDLGVDVTDKTVMLVLGGYLHVLDKKTLRRVGASQFCVDIGNLPMIDRYYESRGNIDLSSLELESTPRNDSQIGLEDFLSDEVITRYMTLSQSFFVILDKADIFINKLHVHNSRMPGMFVSHIRPIYPLITGMGKISEFWSTYEDGQWALNCKDTFWHQRVYNTTDALDENSVADSRISVDPVRHGRGHFLQIGCDI